MGTSRYSEPTVHTMYVCIVEGESLLRSCVQSLPGERQYFNKIEHHGKGFLNTHTTKLDIYRVTKL